METHPSILAWETHPSILAWETPWTEAPGGLQLMGSQKSWGLTETIQPRHTQV